MSGKRIRGFSVHASDVWMAVEVLLGLTVLVVGSLVGSLILAVVGSVIVVGAMFVMANTKRTYRNGDDR